MASSGDREAPIINHPVERNWQDGEQRIHLTPSVLLPPARFQKLTPAAQAPSRVYEGDAGYDLYVATPATVPGWGFVDLHTGIAVALPGGVWARIVGRSSTLRRRGLLVVEGIIDNGYRGELFFGVQNLGGAAVQIQEGERLAQLILQRTMETVWEQVEILPGSERGSNGFGSTGS